MYTGQGGVEGVCMSGPANQLALQDISSMLGGSGQASRDYQLCNGLTLDIVSCH